VPSPSVSLTTTETQVIGQPLTLECNITAVRGIISRMDIVWSSNEVELQRTVGAMLHVTTNSNSVIYRDFYTIPQLSANDDNTTVECDAIINVSPPVVVTGNVTLLVRGMFCKSV